MWWRLTASAFLGLLTPLALQPLRDAACFAQVARLDGPAAADEREPVPIREVIQQSKENSKHLAFGIHVYHSVHHRLPAAVSRDNGGKPLLSWRVHILPFVGANALYDRFHLNEPWDSENNGRLIRLMPDVFRSPASKAQPGRTNYLTLRADNALFPAKGPVRFGDVPDGLPKTIMIVEANDDNAVIWTKPDDFLFNTENPVDGLVGLYEDRFLVVYGDAWVKMLSTDIDSASLNALFTRAGGEFIDSTRTRIVRPTHPETVTELTRSRAQFKLNDSGSISELVFVESKATEADLADLMGLGGFGAVTRLELVEPQFSNAALKHVHLALGVPGQLEMLDLSGTQIDDRGLVYVKDWRSLRVLSLRNTQISDDGLRRLGGLTELDFLDLSWTQVTDAGLGSLHNLRSLKKLGLLSSQVTWDGAARLQEALPLCNVVR